MTHQELRALCELPGHSGYTAVISDIVDGCLSLLDEVGDLEDNVTDLEAQLSDERKERG